MGRLVHAASYRLSPPGRRTWGTVATGPARGLSLLGDARFDAPYWAGDVEPDVQGELTRLVRPGEVAWDVGAHIGFYSCLLARLVGPLGRVVAFEPDEEAAGALEAAAHRNGLAHVEVRRAAVWSRGGSLLFRPRVDSVEGFHGSVQPDGGRVVRATTLDAELAVGPAPALVKIDVEGAEKEVLRRAGRLLREARPAILCEVHLARLGRPELLAAVRGLLESAGYEVCELDPSRSPRHLVALPVLAAHA